MAKTDNKRVRATETELKDRLVAINRVTKVTKGGRNFSFSAIVVVGDENGVVGHGLGKANEVTEAITKGIDSAKKTASEFQLLMEQFLTNKTVSLVVQEYSSDLLLTEQV